MKMELLKKIKETNPVVLSITNFVTIADVANSLSAVGCSPIMSRDAREIPELVSLAGACEVNIGTLNQSDEDLILKTAAEANRQKKPLLLDPVAVAASAYRTDFVQKLLDNYHFDAIRANAGEMAALAGIAWQSKGVDAGEGDGDLGQIVEAVAKKYHTVAILTGEKDYLSDGQQVLCNQYGSPKLTKYVGTGDMLSAIVAGFLAIENDLESAYFACQLFSLVAEKTRSKGVFAWFNEFLDNLNEIDEEKLLNL